MNNGLFQTLILNLSRQCKTMPPLPETAAGIKQCRDSPGGRIPPFSPSKFHKLVIGLQCTFCTTAVIVCGLCAISALSSSFYFPKLSHIATNTLSDYGKAPTNQLWNTAMSSHLTLQNVLQNIKIHIYSASLVSWLLNCADQVIQNLATSLSLSLKE